MRYRDAGLGDGIYSPTKLAAYLANRGGRLPACFYRITERPVVVGMIAGITGTHLS